MTPHPHAANAASLLSPARRRALFSLTALGGGAALAWRSTARAQTPAPSERAAQVNAEADVRMQTCSASNAKGVGLQGEFFSRPNFEGAPTLVRVDGPVELLPADWPSQGVRSARWRGWVRPPLAGRYAFHCSHPGARLTVARQSFDDASAGPLDMVTGRFYPIMLELPQIHGAAQPLRLDWTAPHGMRYTIPRAVLFVPTA